MIRLHFEKIYNKELKNEHCYTAIPFKKGELLSDKSVCVVDSENNVMPTQLKVTARWEDGSIKWLFIRFVADMPANAGCDYFINANGSTPYYEPKLLSLSNIKTEVFEIMPSNDKNVLFESLKYGDLLLDKKVLCGPWLVANGVKYDFQINEWTVLESGSLVNIIRGTGYHSTKGKEVYKFEVTLTLYCDKEWFEIAYRIINTTNEPLDITSISFEHRDIGSGRNTVGISNYKTKYIEPDEEGNIYKAIDAEYLKYEGNEHNSEVFYGTFFAEHCTDRYGLATTIFQAQQNFPKALCVNNEGIDLMLVPEGVGKVVMQAGMAREQKLLVHFYDKSTTMESINFRSTLYQMPIRPMVAPEVFERAGVFEDIFVDNKVIDMEMFLESVADDHSRCYGMLNWGDSPDLGYTSQGRGNGSLVWTNNEYDFPHAATLMYVRTGNRKYMDYMSVASSHWMDVDICHYSDNPLLIDGQWEHTNGHCINGEIVCSHQWVEGLLDCYHLTGNIDAYNSAIGIGKNVLRLLDTPMFKVVGAANAREAGWALRALVALYKETNDESWLEKCDFIVSNFAHWENEFGHWLATYLDDTSIRVVFMISIAVGSLMRYYRVNHRQDIKDMILRSVDDLVDNARLENGLFYYKEIPSLKRSGNNPIILEALTIAYELTGNAKYIEVGMPTLKYILALNRYKVSVRDKEIIEDAVCQGSHGTKGFAQMMLPVTSFYRAAVKEGLLK